jgi:hypothetical protein
MDKFFLRQIVAVWAFDSSNEAVWKCRNVSKLKITQDGTTVRKKDALGATIFQIMTDKSARISFEVAEWDFNVLTGVMGAEERKLDGSDNPYLIEPIHVPHAEIHTLSDADIENGYIELENEPRKNQYGYCEIAVHQIDGADVILTNFHQGLAVDETIFRVDGDKLMLPTNLGVGDMIEIVYEYDSYRGVEIINSSHSIPETWKVRILMLASPVCNIDKISSIWLTARSATPDINTTLDFNVEDNIPITLELGRNYCSDDKLYEIVTAGVDGDEPLYTHNNEALQSYDAQVITTLE